MFGTDRNAFNRTILLLLSLATATSTKTPATITTALSSSTVPTSLLTCPSPSINYITQTLPQQCLTASWASTVPSASERTSNEAGSKSSSPTDVDYSKSRDEASIVLKADVTSTVLSSSAQDAPEHPAVTAGEQTRFSGTTRPSEVAAHAQEDESDALFENADFLSFEDWKRQNLAKIGQSPESLGARVANGPPERRRPGGINNALDSLGEDTEIDIDFGGFAQQGPLETIPSSRSSNPRRTEAGPYATSVGESTSRDGSGHRKRSKDAGKTCKERTNYASYDCAATTLKTNPECKSSSSVLVENKDSYMLNICSASNKFFIVELCDNILIDTVVLANFEFFSSMFRSFRISVSDRYPTKLEKWRELGVYEARNSREVQAFLVENPLIWARYLRVEILSHYGNEYYCPVSLLRVHGTTMMEEFNSEMKNPNWDDDSETESGEALPQLEPDPVPELAIAEALERSLQMNRAVPTATDSSNRGMDTTDVTGSATVTSSAPDSDLTRPNDVLDRDANFSLNNATIKVRLKTMFDTRLDVERVCLPRDAPPNVRTIVSSSSIQGPTEILSRSPTDTNSTGLVNATQSSFSASQPVPSNQSPSPISSPADVTSTHVPVNGRTPTSSPTGIPNSTSSGMIKPSGSSTQPPASNPTTQESFFKSIHKRLQLLEANSTLSLQYIEEQSRILRDAFSKVERRQMSKTTSFLETLNTTVLTELLEFRKQYDQIWQSTILELSSQREQSQREVLALSTRLTLLAEEVVFQKRMTILQFMLVVLCLGLFIFSRSPSTAPSLEMPPILQNTIKRSSATVSRHAPLFDNPPASPSASRPSSGYGPYGFLRTFTHGRSPSEESYGAQNHTGPGIEYSPPTPESGGSMAGDIDSSPGPGQGGTLVDKRDETDDE